MNERNPEFRLAIDEFESALALNPRLYDALLMESKTYWKLGKIKGNRDAFEKAKLSADKITAPGGLSAEIHRWRARLLAFYDRKWAEAEEEYFRAAARDKNLKPDPDFLLWRGRYREAVESVQNLLKQEGPNPVEQHMDAGWNYFFARKFDLAFRHAEEAWKRDRKSAPACWLMGQCLERTGKKNETAAVRFYIRALEIDGLLDAASLAQYRASFLESKMNGFWRTYSNKCANWISPYELAAIYAQLNETDKAFETLEAFRDLPLEKPLVADPRFDPIRKDRRFAQLMKYFGL